MTHDSAHNHYCDIVMKGGITSGVVYPLAIKELAQTYKFKNIGGTSAGAIAATSAAAAEYCRATALKQWLNCRMSLPAARSKNFSNHSSQRVHFSNWG